MFSAGLSTAAGLLIQCLSFSISIAGASIRFFARLAHAALEAFMSYSRRGKQGSVVRHKSKTFCSEAVFSLRLQIRS